MKFGICLPISLNTEAHSNIEIAKAADMGKPRGYGEGITSVKTIARKAGRYLSGFRFSVRNRLKVLKPEAGGMGHAGKSAESHACSLRGNVSEIADFVELYRESGVTHIVLDPDAEDVEEITSMIVTVSKEIIPIFRDT